MGQSRAAALLATHELTVQDIGAEVEVRRHAGARRMTLRVSRTRRAIIVTLPLHCDLKQAGAFVATHLDWVRERLGNLPTPAPFEDGGALPLRGETHLISFEPRAARRVVEVVRDARVGARLVVRGDREHAPRRLRDWLVEEARRDLDHSVMLHANRLRLRPKRIAVRDQSSRWGSCSTTGLLSFSWRLILTPPFVLDYVAAHEVAHLAEMNHGPRFWSLVRQTCPETESAKAWLRRFGLDLHRYGAEG